jgi:basic membrane protein A
MRGSGTVLALAGLSFLAGLALGAEPATTGGTEPGAKAGLPVVMVTDEAGLGDQGFNDVAWEGILRAERELGIHKDIVQSRSQSEYVGNLNYAAGRARVVVSVGFLIADAVARVAPAHPDTCFVHIEGDIPGPNVLCFDFKGEQAGFLAGCVAALFTKSGQVGVVAGREIPPVKAYLNGFAAGVATVKATFGKEVTSQVLYAGTFNDPVKGKSLGEALLARGCDVIFKAAGNTGVGVLELARERPDLFIVAEDLDIDARLPGRILASTRKCIDVAVFTALKEIAEGRFQPGHRVLGMKEGGIGLSEMKFTRQLFSEEQLSFLDRVKQALREGRLAVPASGEELQAFKAPVLR